MSNETEEYFKALGYGIVEDGEYNCAPAFHLLREYSGSYPDIRDSFTQLKKFVIDPMEAEGYAFELNTQAQRCVWYLTGMIPVVEFQEKITNGDIPLAMIISATRYFKSKEW